VSETSPRCPTFLGWQKRRINAREEELLGTGSGSRPNTRSGIPRSGPADSASAWASRAPLAQTSRAADGRDVRRARPINRQRIYSRCSASEGGARRSSSAPTTSTKDPVATGSRSQRGRVLAQYDTPDGILKDPADDSSRSHRRRRACGGRLALRSSRNVPWRQPPERCLHFPRCDNGPGAKRGQQKLEPCKTERISRRRRRTVPSAFLHMRTHRS